MDEATREREEGWRRTLAAGDGRRGRREKAANVAALSMIAVAVVLWLAVGRGPSSGKVQGEVPAEAPAAIVWTQPEAPRKTAAEMRSLIGMGLSESQVRAAIGDPESTQQMESMNSDTTFWYFSGHQLQVCFENGKVTGINQW